MGAPIVVGILAAIRAGVPAAKLIIKYGKKAYDAAKKSKKPPSKPKEPKVPKKTKVKEESPFGEELDETTRKFTEGKFKDVDEYLKAYEPKTYPMKLIKKKNKGGPIRKNKGGPVDARKIAKKYFKGTF